MARRLFLGIFLLLVLAAPAAGDVGSRKQQVDDRITRLHEKIASAQAREGVLTGQISAMTSKIRSLENDVGAATTRLGALQQDLELHQRKLAKLTQLFQFETRRLQFLRKQYHAALRRLSVRLVAIYESSDPDALSVILSASSFSDLIDQLDYVRQVAAQDKEITAEVASAKTDMAAARERTRQIRHGVAVETNAIASRTNEARRVRDRLVASRDALASARTHERATLASVKTNERAFIDEANALAAVSAQLGAQIAAAQRSSAVSGSSGSGTPSAAGLIWPVSGPVVSPFGMRWGRMHEGIDIGVPYGTPIHAAASGTVIYAGWMGGYGNLIVIDHGNGLATAYAHQSAFAVGNGASVVQGETIGYVGCTGHCFGPHLHFEVRVNGAAVDPLGYL
ncbi:MAG TPA: peptidoglycan DD-metalloendopeptidase family protein [Gaiellaceae bacterium]